MLNLLCGLRGKKSFYAKAGGAPALREMSVCEVSGMAWRVRFYFLFSINCLKIVWLDRTDRVE